jgi:hypothetical protein
VREKFNFPGGHGLPGENYQVDTAFLDEYFSKYVPNPLTQACRSFEKFTIFNILKKQKL